MDDKHRFNDAFSEGHYAVSAGKKRKENPYPVGTVEHDGWDMGWWDRYEDLRSDPLP
jgi:hypothetical protein